MDYTQQINALGSNKRYQIRLFDPKNNFVVVTDHRYSNGKKMHGIFCLIKKRMINDTNLNQAQILFYMNQELIEKEERLFSENMKLENQNIDLSSGLTKKTEELEISKTQAAFYLDGWEKSKEDNSKLQSNNETLQSALENSNQNNNQLLNLLQERTDILETALRALESAKKREEEKDAKIARLEEIERKYNQIIGIMEN